MERLATQVMRVTKAMAEQSGNAEAITTTAANLGQHASQASRGMEEQAIAMKRITTGASNISKQIRTIAQANTDHAHRAAEILDKLTALRLAKTPSGRGDSPGRATEQPTAEARNRSAKASVVAKPKPGQPLPPRRARRARGQE
jgi:hypothetical protein